MVLNVKTDITRYRYGKLRNFLSGRFLLVSLINCRIEFPPESPFSLHKPCCTICFSVGNVFSIARQLTIGCIVFSEKKIVSSCPIFFHQIQHVAKLQNVTSLLAARRSAHALPIPGLWWSNFETVRTVDTMALSCRKIIFSPRK